MALCITIYGNDYYISLGYYYNTTMMYIYCVYSFNAIDVNREVYFFL